ncbi:MAG: sugar ABC transporter permease [Clostridia bacterium]|nr:sugar ABC transporter permease [Clostridia bacterium]
MAKKENTASTEVKEEVILDSERKPTKEEIKAAKEAAKRAKRQRKAAAALSERQARAGYWFILPWIVGVIFLFLVPVITSLIYSFCEVGVRAGGIKLDFQGIDNYIYIFRKDPDFIPALLDSLKDMLYQVPIIAFFGMFIAQILNQKFVGRTVARVMFFLPVIIASGVILEILSKTGMSTSVSLNASSNIFTFQEESVILKILNQSGLSPAIIDYLKSLVGNIFDITWKSGIQILLYLSALQGIPKSYYEVSSMEGATAWEEYWKITFPLLSPMTLVCVVYTIIDSFTYYQNKVMQLIDKNGVATGNAGIAAAMAWTYFIIIAVILVLIVKFVFAKTVYTEE